ncbi:MAG TPA: hypothetical protein VJ508_08225, partial [Saprospiraceae bacterium]|nr:hypothetical protein [Saprospiraceae bacterium]
TLDPEIWLSWRGIISMYATSPGFREYWKMRESMFTPAFRQEINSWSDSNWDNSEKFAKGVK